MVHRIGVTGLAVLLACESPSNPSYSGTMAVRVVLSPGGSRSLETGKVRLQGPTSKSLDATPGAQVNIPNLAPGQYTLTLEGFIGGELEQYGKTADIEVVDGQNTPVTVTLASFVPAITALPASAVGTQTFNVGFGFIQDATYQVETASDETFNSRFTSTNTGTTSTNVAVTSYGTYFVRVRAKDPFLQVSRPSPLDSIRVQECQNCWRDREDMPTDREWPAVASLKGLLYAVGGDQSIGALGTNEVFDPADGHWTRKQAMTTPRTHLGAGVIGDTLYAVGGMLANFAIVGTVEAYNPTTDSWSARPALNVPRAGIAVAVANGRLYAIGGDTLGTVESWAPGEVSWTIEGSIPSQRTFVAAAALKDSFVYAIGGRDRFGAEVTTVERYNIFTHVWGPHPPMSVARGFLGAGVVNDTIYAVGGLNFTDGELTLVEALGPGSPSWITKSPLVRGRRAFLGVGVLNGLLYAVGGSFMDGPLNFVEVYSP